MKDKKKLVSLFLLGVAALSLIVWGYTRREVVGKKYLRINKTDVIVEVADTEEKRNKGLGDRDSMPENSGMLFVFEEAKHWEFWMYGMRFPLDFVWIQNNKVVDLDERVPPPMYTENNPIHVRPNVDVQYVLEVNQGWIQKHNIKIGDLVEFHL